MATLEIIVAPHPVLAKKARPVEEEEFGSDLQNFLKDMAETMYAAPGVGLAAPQVGDSRQIIVADPGNDEGKAERKLYMMVNPKIIRKSKESMMYEESCLSVPEFSLMVKRHKEVTVQWQDGAGKIHEEDFSEFPAIVIQHEMDHLKGVTLLDKSSRFKKSRYISKRKKGLK